MPTFQVVMTDVIQTLLSPGSFIPHGHCYLWQTPLVGLHILSDGFIALSYYSIPFFLIVLAYRRQDLPFRWLFWLFGAFIISCGTTHWMQIVTLWYPVYWVTGIIKAITALVSLWTALSLIPLFPEVLAFPSPLQLKQMNTLLEQEIQERKAVEIALRRSEARLREAQEVAHIGNWEFDILTGEIFWSDEVFHIFGLTPDQPVPTYEQHLERNFHPDDRERLHQAVLSTLEQGEPYELDLRMIRADGSTGWILTKGKRVVNSENQVIRLFGIALDITARKQAEVEQQRLNQMKDDFVSTVSHELRTPLTSIKMSAHMLELVLEKFQSCFRDKTHCQEDGFPLFPSSKVKQYLEILRSQCEQELSLVNDLLELQRLEAQAVPVHKEDIELASWLPQVIRPYYQRAQARQQVLEVHVASDLPTVHSSQEILTRILNELLTNACKYTPPHESITVEAEVQEETLYLSITNQGVEISATEIQHIFDRFYRIPHSDRWHQGGTGLGLALVERQVHNLGGAIRAWSQASRVQFVIELPLR